MLNQTDNSLLQGLPIPDPAGDQVAAGNDPASLRTKLLLVEEENKKLKSELEKLTVELTNKGQALEFQEGLYNEQLKKVGDTQAKLDEALKDNETMAAEIAKLTNEFGEKESQLMKSRAAISLLETEREDAVNKLEAFQEDSQRKTTQLVTRLEEIEAENAKLKEELQAATNRYDEMLRGGDHADGHTKKFISGLEGDLVEAKKTLEKYK